MIDYVVIRFDRPKVRIYSCEVDAIADCVVNQVVVDVEIELVVPTGLVKLDGAASAAGRGSGRIRHDSVPADV